MLVTSVLVAGLSLAASPQPHSFHAHPAVEDAPSAAPRLRVTGVLVGATGLAGLATTATLQYRELATSARCAGTDAMKVALERGCFEAPPPAFMAMRVGGLATLAGAGLASGYLLGRAYGIGEAARGRRYLDNRKPLILVTALTVTTSSTLLLAANVGGFARERACESTQCMHDARTMRYVTTDLATAGLAFGLGLGGHTLGRSRELRRASDLTLSPSATRGSASLSLSGRF